MALASFLAYLSSSVNNMASLSWSQLTAHPCFKYFSSSCYLWDDVQTAWCGDKALQHPICPTAFRPHCCGPMPAMPDCFALWLPYLCASAPAVPAACSVFCACEMQFLLPMKSTQGRLLSLTEGLLHHSWKLDVYFSGSPLVACSHCFCSV